jgi:hypothetical protein
MRYYIGVDWADGADAVWVEDESATKILSRSVAHTIEGFTEWGRWLDEQRAAGVELWAAIEKPDGRVVDFLLEHGVVVFAINPKASDRARDRFRASASKAIPSTRGSWPRSSGPITTICVRSGRARRRRKNSGVSRATMRTRCASKRDC